MGAHPPQTTEGVPSQTRSFQPGLAGRQPNVPPVRVQVTPTVAPPPAVATAPVQQQAAPIAVPSVKSFQPGLPLATMTRTVSQYTETGDSAEGPTMVTAFRQTPVGLTATNINLVTNAPASRFPVFAAAWGTIGILLCYGLAVALGHVPIFLPMISDCGVTPPEKYIFRFVLIPTAMYIIRVKYLVTDFVKSAAPPDEHDKLAAKLAAVAGFCLGVVGAVNEKEDNAIHTTAAVIFFVLSVIYMIIMVKRLRQINSTLPAGEEFVTEDSLTKKYRMAIAMGITTVLYMISKGYIQHMERTYKYYPQESGGRILLAMLEWTTTIGIIFCYAGFAPDFARRGFETGTFTVPSATLPTTGAPVPPVVVDPAEPPTKPVA